MGCWVVLSHCSDDRRFNNLRLTRFTWLDCIVVVPLTGKLIYKFRDAGDTDAEVKNTGSKYSIILPVAEWKPLVVYSYGAST